MAVTQSREAARTRAARHKVFEPVLLTVAGVEVRAHLLNISTTGALVHVVPPVARGDRLSLRLGTSRLAAQVARADGPRAGVAFDRPLDAALVASLLA